MATGADVLRKSKDEEVKFVDLRFTDFRGKEQHVQVPEDMFDAAKFTEGRLSTARRSPWKGIEASDMLLMPDPATAVIDPFVGKPAQHHLRRHRAVHRQGATTATRARWPKRAEAYLKSSGIWRHRVLRSGTRVLHFRLGRVESGHVRLYCKIFSEEAAWGNRRR